MNLTWYFERLSYLLSTVRLTLTKKKKKKNYSKDLQQKNFPQMFEKRLEKWFEKRVRQTCNRVQLIDI